MIVAIDPGLKGGIASLHEDGSFQTWPMPIRIYTYYGRQKRQRSKPQKHIDVAQLHWLCSMVQPEAIVVEQQVPMPGQSSVANGTTFTNYGIVLSLRLLAPLYLVTALRWKKVMAVSSDKAEATKQCRELFPDGPERDGEAEALMLALYWEREGKHDWSTSTELRDAGARGKAKVVRRRLPKGTGGQRAKRARLAGA